MPTAILTGLRFLGSLASRGGSWIFQNTTSLVRQGGRAALTKSGNAISGFFNQQRRPQQGPYGYSQPQTTTQKILGDKPLLYAAAAVITLPLVFMYALYELIINASTWTSGLQ